MRKNYLAMLSSSVLVIAVLFPFALMGAKPAKPIVVRIDDAPDGPPIVTVKGAPGGFDIDSGPDIVNPAIEDGGLITLFGVDQFGSINPSGNGWRFVDASLPVDAFRNATDIVWIQHDLLGTGDLQIGFNTLEDGLYYVNPIFTGFDASAGPATNQWVTVYADATIVVEFKARTP